MALTEATKKKISDALKGRARPADVKERIRKTLQGKEHTDDRKRHMSEAALRRGVTPAQLKARRERKCKPRLTLEEKLIRKRLYRTSIRLLRRVLKYTGTRQTTRSADVLGYTHHELRTHLESRFKPGMSWENYGFGSDKWHIDHIRPVSSFPDTSSIAEINALNNLQPLWQNENLRKSAKWQS